MRSLIFLEPGRLEWQEVPEPRIEDPRDAIVRPVAASACDLDRAIVAGMTPFTGPFAIGHECVAEVVETGGDIEGLSPGQVVVVPWHVACGICSRCGAGLTAHCSSVPYGAMFGLPVAGDWGGTFADLLRVPHAGSMLVPISQEVPFECIVGVGDNLTTAYELVARHAATEGGTRVLVLGSGSIGLYAGESARALGASQITYVDDDAQRLEVAQRLGLAALEGPPHPNLGEFDLLVEASWKPRWLQQGLPLLAPEGACEALIYLEDVPLPMFQMYVRGVRFHIGRSNVRTHIPAVLSAIGSGTLRPERVVTTVHEWEEAPEVLGDQMVKPLFVRTLPSP